MCELASGAKCAADIGTDHGYAAIWLLLHGAERVTAADIRPGPLAAARLNAEEYGFGGRIRFELCDGLDFEGAEEHDTVLIAGMGGETIAGIIARAGWTRLGARLILQPQTKLDELIETLRESGYALETAKLAEEGGRLYTALAVRGGEGGFTSAEDALLAASDPLLPRWLDMRIAKERRILMALESAATERDKSGALALLSRLEALRKEL